eukprot:10135826-Lingulodinium_polyedra.AAC.1
MVGGHGVDLERGGERLGRRLGRESGARGDGAHAEHSEARAEPVAVLHGGGRRRLQPRVRVL